VRDARAQGAQERGPRRDRDLARRRCGGCRARIPLIFADAALRLAGAILLEALALVVWNIGTRSPSALLRDIAVAAREPRTLFAGSLSLVVGLIFVAAATVLILPALPNPDSDLVPVEIFTFLVALGIELLVGDDVRRVASGRSRSDSV
jgi:hypothetical protein